MERVIFENEERRVSFNDTPEVRDKVFDRLIKYYVEHECFCGESIHQMDNPIIDAPSVMSDICDNILKIKDKWLDDDDD